MKFLLLPLIREEPLFATIKNESDTMMNEIGGYIEFEHYHLPMLHENAIALNCGRSCLAYLIETKKIKKIVLPYFLCNSVINLCEKYQLTIRYYNITSAFHPEKLSLAEGEWLYLVNYYGQMSNEQLRSYVTQFKNVIVDQAQAYFQPPMIEVDTLYTCRKFFGVPDGGFLYTNSKYTKELEQDVSFQKMQHLLGRFEKTASEFYVDAATNNKLFAAEPIKQTSKLTLNLLHGIQYERVKNQRTENYSFLFEQFKEINLLNLKKVEGAFAYPLLLENGKKIRAQLLQEKIYIPILWPNVLCAMTEDTLEYQYANNILPLPCDQRYNEVDMKKMVAIIMKTKETL